MGSHLPPRRTSPSFCARPRVSAQTARIAQPSSYAFLPASLRPQLRTLRRAFRAADAAFVAVHHALMALLVPIATGARSLDGRRDPKVAGELRAMAARRARTSRAWWRAWRALGRAELADHRARLRAGLLGDARARARVTAELGGERALRAWEARQRTHMTHSRELAEIMAEHASHQSGLSHPLSSRPLSRRAALAELARRVAGRASMPATLPPRIRAELAGEVPSIANGCIRERCVHPDVATRLLAARHGPRRDVSQTFALAPIPRLVSVPRGRVRTVLTIDVRAHGLTLADIRAQLVAYRAMERARRRATLRHLPAPEDQPPIRLTPDELRRGWQAVLDERPKGEGGLMNAPATAPPRQRAAAPARLAREVVACGRGPPEG